MEHKPIVIGCDNAAVELKNTLIEVLKDEGVEFEDIGVNSSDDKTVYPLISKRVCEAIIESNYEKEGIIICGTGIGMAMTANKFPGIFAAVCHDMYSAERLRLSNNGNVICFGARIMGPELAKKILREWLSLTYVPGGRSQPKVDTMRQIDKDNRCA
ncbi:ribose 5-phosphate isomerase B [bacterium]|nr:ribose 5-phosphate isomerase B [bacterium]